MYHLNYRVVRNGAHISLLELAWNEAEGPSSENTKEKELASIFIDSTDNRLTIQSINPDIPQKGIETLVRFLDEQVGGKEIFIIPESLKAYFEAYGFVSNPLANPASARFRETSFANLLNIKGDADSRIELITKSELEKASPGNIEELMKHSQFLASKLEQYHMQGYQGFQLMCDYSEPIGLQDKTTEKIVAFCRLTPLNEGYYLSDTFVDEVYFGSKQIGTEKLYTEVGKKFGSGRVFLIAPPNRVDEFEQVYGCFAPKDVMLKFSSPKLELTNTFEEEKNRVTQKHALKK